MDAPWLSGECVPGIAAGIDDGVVVFEDAIAELVLAQVLPDILDWIEFGRIGRQFEQADVGWHIELAAGLMPAGAIKQHDGVASCRDFSADLGEV